MLTKKELYHLSVKISGDVLRSWFGAPEQSFNAAYFTSKPEYKALIKKVYDQLALHCLTNEKI